MNRRAAIWNGQPVRRGWWRGLAALGLGLGSSGCTHLNRERPPPTPDAIQAFLQGAQDPRLHWVRVARLPAGAFQLENVNRLHPGQQAVLEFSDRRRNAAASVTIEDRFGGKHAALLDTSQAWSWTPLARADTLDLIPLAPPGAFSLTVPWESAPLSAQVAVARTLVAQFLRMESVSMAVLTSHGDLGPLARGQPNVQLVLGTDFWRAFRWFAVDYPRRRVLLSVDREFRLPPGLMPESVPLDWQRGAYTVTATLDGITREFVLDLAGDYAVALPEAAAGGPPRELMLGPLPPARLPVTPLAAVYGGPDERPRLGQAFFRAWRLVFDNRARRLLFLPP
ncbi:MAG: hypothetical protein K9N49_08245 [Candidatus Marinimicrobia bacterium]|nr:hypothetical protein [Candidatus Neomarinimicrobiota bacterium]